MSKFYIEFKKVKGVDGKAQYKNFKLKQDGIIIKRTYRIDNEELLKEDLINNKVNYERKNGKRIINDKNFVLKYSTKSKEILRQNKYKKAIFTAATIGTLLSSYVGFNLDKGKQNENIQTTQIEIDNISTLADENNITEEDIILVDNTTPTIDNNINKEIKIDVIEDTNKNNITIDNTNPNNNEVYTFAIDYEDRSNDEIQEYIKYKYNDFIKKYSDMYGIDENLVTAIIIQENKNNEKNYSDVGGYGLMQVESIWDGEELYSYNFIDNEYERIVVDTARARDDDEYSIKVGCMIYNNYYQFIRSEYYVNSNTLTEEECVIAALFAYNKGIGTVMNELDNFTNFDTFLNDVRQAPGGDNEYIEHVLSYENGQTITNKNKDGSFTSLYITINNLNDLGIRM